MQTVVGQPNPQPRLLRLLTLNTWKCDGAYALRLQAMVNQLRPLNADVIALQEVFSTPDGEMHTGRHLAQALNMALVDAPARGKRRCIGGQWRASHSGLAILTRWPVLRSQILPLPSDDADGERLALLCELDLNGHRFCVVNTHLTHLTNAQALRQTQWKTVLSLAVRGPRASRVAVCGDLNAPLSASELREPMAHGCWYGVANTTGLLDKVTHRDAYGFATDLDHVVARRDAGLHWRKAAVVLDHTDPATGVVPSDHAAVWVDGWLAPAMRTS